MITALHVLAGLSALIAGAVALSVAKGGRLHRHAGLVFVAAMVAMTLSGFVVAAARGQRLNLLAATVTLYLVLTAWLTVRRPAALGRRADVALMSVALMAGCAGIGLAAWAAARGKVDWVAPYTVFGSVALLAALGDWRVLRAGGLSGVPRIVRHLWRMGLAMWIATASFFLGQAKVFPEALRGETGLRSIPVVLVLVAVLYWLARQVALRRRLRLRA